MPEGQPPPRFTGPWDSNGKTRPAAEGTRAAQRKEKEAVLPSQNVVKNKGKLVGGALRGREHQVLLWEEREVAKNQKRGPLGEQYLST